MTLLRSWLSLTGGIVLLVTVPFVGRDKAADWSRRFTIRVFGVG